jgi:outer membrane murein-binding lipoprotein Lpp
VFASGDEDIYCKRKRLELKLAEALVLRADVQKRIEGLRERLRISALVQEGEEPPERPKELLEELARLLVQLTDLVKRINRTNLQARLPDGRTIMEALAERDTLALHCTVLETVAAAATPRFDRLQRSEIRQVPTVTVSELRAKSDELARNRRQLDTEIQAANWTTELAV